MATLGAQMIRDNAAETERQWGYLVTATAAAQLSQGDRKAARASIENNWLKLDQQMRDWPTIELMLRLTTGADSYMLRDVNLEEQRSRRCRAR